MRRWLFVAIVVAAIALGSIVWRFGLVPSIQPQESSISQIISNVPLIDSIAPVQAEAAAAPDSAPSTNVAADAESLYSGKCSACHGANRQGGFGPPLTQTALSAITATTLTGIITNGRGAMPTWGGILTPAEISAMVQFLKGSTTTATTPSPTPTTPAAPANGTIDAAAIFAAKCSGCHGANRQGGFGPPLTQTALSAIPASTLTGIITNGQGAMPTWGGILTPAEISAIVQFLKGSTPTTPSPTPTTPTAPANGTIDAAAIFAAKCSACHGANRQGGFGPPLTQTALSAIPATTLTATITNGRGAMPAWGSVLTPAEISAMVQFLKESATTVTVPSPTPTTPTASANGTTDAAAIFAAKCSGCHGANRQGGFGPPLTQTALSAIPASTLISTITNGRGAMPTWGGILTPAEISAMVQFLQGNATTPPTGTTTSPPAPILEPSQLYTTMCSSCHGINRQGKIGPPLTSKSLSCESINSITRAIITGPDEMPAFGGILTSAQITMLAQFLKTTP